MQPPVLESEQERLLDAALKMVRAESFEMKRSLDRSELMDGLRHASQMIAELRTATLTPKFYYRLYVDVINELQHLSSFLQENYLQATADNSSTTPTEPISTTATTSSLGRMDSAVNGGEGGSGNGGTAASTTNNNGRRVADLYETVQYTGNIIPRLYLLVTVGVVYIKSGEVPARDVLRDLVEMCRGVQHPLRGLFLRNYLLTSTKELIPDGPAVVNGKIGDDHPTDDAIEFIMTNFSEMNKLWVRMQHLGPTREREKRERERRELRILVGTNLMRLAQLEHLTLDIYRRVVLPGILEQSVSCKEPISQEYLMECVVQVFPDEYHVATLHEFLDACAELHPDVRVKNVLSILIDHLAQYTHSEEGRAKAEASGVELFEVFRQHAEQVVDSRQQQMPVEDVIAIHSALLNLALQCYSEREEYANTAFAATADVFKKLQLDSIAFNSVIGRELVKLLKLPIDFYRNAIRLLPLEAYPTVLAFLDYKGRTHLACYLINNMLENGTTMGEEAHIDRVFKLIDSLLADQADDPSVPSQGRQRSSHRPGSAISENDEFNNGEAAASARESESEDFEEEQNLVAKLIHLVRSGGGDGMVADGTLTVEGQEQQFRLLGHVRKALGKGGKWRLRHTLPALVFATLRMLAGYLKMEDHVDSNRTEHDARIGKIFHFLMSTINALRMQAERPELALRLNLQSSLISDRLEWGQSAEVSYEFISKAFAIYEEEVSESREQLRSLTSLIGSVERMVRLAEENHEPLRNQCALYAAKLLKKPDQARMVCLVARLFWYGKTADAAPGGLRDGGRVAECLKKVVKIASQCMEDMVQVNLYIHILSTYMHFYEEGCDEITVDSVNQLICKIRDALLQLDPSPETDQLKEIFKLMLQRIRNARDDPPEGCTMAFDGFAVV